MNLVYCTYILDWIKLERFEILQFLVKWTYFTIPKKVYWPKKLKLKSKDSMCHSKK